MKVGPVIFSSESYSLLLTVSSREKVKLGQALAMFYFLVQVSWMSLNQVKTQSFFQETG